MGSITAFNYNSDSFESSLMEYLDKGSVPWGAVYECVGEYALEGPGALWV